jgi:hypothetical protein
MRTGYDSQITNEDRIGCIRGVTNVLLNPAIRVSGKKHGSKAAGGKYV